MSARAHVVSVTRLGLRRDKRTFQNASSLARLGYDSTVVEGEPSGQDGDCPFELVTIEGTEPLSEPGETAEGEAGEPPAGTARAIGWARRLPGRALAPRTLWRLHRHDNELTYDALPDADLYYLTFFWQFPAVERKCRELGVPFIYDANDAYWLWPGYRWYPAAFRGWLRSVERRAVRRAAAFITVSEGVADLLERRYGRRPEVVRNMHDLRVDADCELDLRRAAGVADGDFLVAIVGNDKPSDAVEEALVAMTQLPDAVHLALLGAGYEKRVARVEQLGLSGRVHLVPPVSPDQVTSAIRNADACLINIKASDVHMHALPTRLFSAIAAGLPVLHPPLPEVRALADEYGLGPAVDAEDPSSIAAGVRELLDDPDAEARYRAAVEKAATELNWEQEEKVLARIIEQVLER